MITIIHWDEYIRDRRITFKLDCRCVIWINCIFEIIGVAGLTSSGITGHSTGLHRQQPANRERLFRPRSQQLLPTYALDPISTTRSHQKEEAPDRKRMDVGKTRGRACGINTGRPRATGTSTFCFTHASHSRSSSPSRTEIPSTFGPSRRLCLDDMR